MGQLTDKVALVLGAAGKDNMGQTIARKYASEGAKVVVAGRHEEALAELASEIDGAWVCCDITDKEAIEAMVSYSTQTYGRLDVAVNATGWGLVRRFTKTTAQDLEKIIALQFTGPFQFFQVLVDAMGKGGSIIQISSATATIIMDNHAAYMGTKAGFDHVVRCVANEYGKKGIRVNSISPGITETPMTTQTFQNPAMVETFNQCYPLGRVGTSDDIAHAAVFLASDGCFMTGENLQVNGGLTLRGNPSNQEIAAALAADGK